MRKTESDKKSKPNSSSGPKSSQAQRNPNKRKARILPETESSSTDMPKSPSGRLIITKHRLKKTLVTTTSVRKVCCTVCHKAFDDKDELKKHHHATHMNSQCDVCNKSFATKRSLHKHSYMYLEKQIKCKDCDQKFSFTEPSLCMLEKFQRSSALPNIKYNCALLSIPCGDIKAQQDDTVVNLTAYCVHL